MKFQVQKIFMTLFTNFACLKYDIILWNKNIVFFFCTHVTRGRNLLDTLSFLFCFSVHLLMSPVYNFFFLFIYCYIFCTNIALYVIFLSNFFLYIYISSVLWVWVYVTVSFFATVILLHTKKKVNAFLD